MPRPGPRRVHVAVKVHPDAAARYDEQAARTGVGLSTRLRRMLTFAERHMPDDYREEDA